MRRADVQRRQARRADRRLTAATTARGDVVDVDEVASLPAVLEDLGRPALLQGWRGTARPRRRTGCSGACRVRTRCGSAARPPRRRSPGSRSPPRCSPWTFVAAYTFRGSSGADSGTSPGTSAAPQTGTRRLEAARARSAARARAAAPPVRGRGRVARPRRRPPSRRRTRRGRRRLRRRPAARPRCRGRSAGRSRRCRRARPPARPSRPGGRPPRSPPRPLAPGRRSVMSSPGSTARSKTTTSWPAAVQPVARRTEPMKPAPPGQQDPHRRIGRSGGELARQVDLESAAAGDVADGDPAVVGLAPPPGRSPARARPRRRRRCATPSPRQPVSKTRGRLSSGMPPQASTTATRTCPSSAR